MTGIPEENVILQKLKDAGCDDTVIQKFFCLGKEGKRTEQFRLLSLHKASLLDQMHVSEHMIDCLDYLLFTMQKNI